MENNQVVEEPKKKISVKTILTIVGNVIFYAVIIALFLFSLMNINAGDGTQNFPNLFGKGMLSVESGSMERNPNGYQRPEWEEYTIGEIKTGDLVYVDVFNGDLNSIKVGDVITFVGTVANSQALVTHRVVYINLENDYVYTQGDYVVTNSQTDSLAYDMEDPFSTKNYNLEEAQRIEHVSKTNIKGVVTGVKAGAGSVLSNIRQNWLFYFVLPIAAILLIEIVFVVKNFLDLRNEKNKASLQDDKEAMLAELEAEKEKMRQELLAELRAQQAKEVQTEEVKEALEKPVEETEEEPIEEEKATEAVEENEESTDENVEE